MSTEVEVPVDSAAAAAPQGMRKNGMLELFLGLWMVVAGSGKTCRREYVLMR